ncbi:MAG: HEAT repeat domain-containing protein [Pseudomonadota bacterium]
MFNIFKLTLYSSRLRSKNFLKRESAAVALGKLGDARAVEPLYKIMDNYKEDRSVRQAAAIALGRLGDVRAVEQLIRTLLEYNSTSIRQDCARLLGQIGGVRAVETLIKVLSYDASIRIAAAEALSQLGQPQWSQWIKGDDNDFARLGASREPCAVEPLISVLNYSKDRDLRSVAARALGKLGNVQAIEPLIKALGDEYHIVRYAAIEALDVLADVSTVEPLISALNDRRNAAAHGAVVKLLGQLNDPRAVEPLIKALGDEYHNEKPLYEEYHDMRAAAATALGKLGDVRAVEPLMKALDDNHRSVRAAAATALGKLGDVCAVEPLIRALDDNESSVGAAAATALGELGDARAVEPLINELDKRESLSAAVALGRIGDCRAAQPLINVLCRNAYLRQAAAVALGEIGQPQWSQWIKGDDNDFSRLVECREPRVVELLFEALCRSVSWAIRKTIATSILGILSRQPELRIANVSEIFQSINRPHGDVHIDGPTGQSSDCTYNNRHHDTGIGLEIPPQMTEKDF